MTWMHVYRRPIGATITAASLFIGLTAGHSLAGGSSAQEIDRRIQRATIGATCLTRERALLAVTLTDLQRSIRVIQQDDAEAHTRLQESGRMIHSKPDITVFIEDRMQIDGFTVVQVRPKGHLITIWMLAAQLNCPAPAAKNGQAAARGQR